MTWAASCSLALLLLIAGQTAAGVVDDSGQRLQPAQPAGRIISLAPHLTELLYAAGAGDRLVGAVRYSDYPAAAGEVPRVGDAHNFDLERIVALQPDLIVAWRSGNPAHQVRKLQQLQIPVYISEPAQLADIARTLTDLGRLSGTLATARAAADNYLHRLQRLRETYAGREPVSVFYQIWHQPLITVGGKHLINEVIEVCGGKNVFAALGQLAPPVTEEAVLAAAPEIIIAGSRDGVRPDWLDDWRRWPQLPAVRLGQLATIPADHLQRHTPRLLDGTARLCEQLEQARRQKTQSGQ